MYGDPNIKIDSVLEVKKYTHDLDAVIFDLDDTLYPEMEYVRSGYHAVAGLFPELTDMENRLWMMFCRNAPAIDETLKSYHILTDDNRRRCLRAYRWQKPDIHLYDGVYPMLVRLREKNLHLGLITDGRPEGQRAKIAALKIEPLFDEIIITDELGGIEFRKPNEKAFVLMCRRLGVQYSRAAYVGDNMNKDFIAPGKLGMKSMMVNNPDGIYYKHV